MFGIDIAMSEEKRGHRRMKLCVSGAAATGHCGLNAYEKGKNMGREIARRGGVLVTGATTGFPLWAAIGAKEEEGLSIGFSPASSEREHVEMYNLPLDYLDVIVYTGAGFAGRDLLLVRSSDAVLFGCGRIGTLHEFLVAYVDKKPIGILEAEWETDEVIKAIVKGSHYDSSNIIFDADPASLVAKVIALIEENRKKEKLIAARRASGVIET